MRSVLPMAFAVTSKEQVPANAITSSLLVILFTAFGFELPPYGARCVLSVSHAKRRSMLLTTAASRDNASSIDNARPLTITRQQAL